MNENLSSANRDDLQPTDIDAVVHATDTIETRSTGIISTPYQNTDGVNGYDVSVVGVMTTHVVVKTTVGDGDMRFDTESVGADASNGGSRVDSVAATHAAGVSGRTRLRSKTQGAATYSHGGGVATGIKSLLQIMTSGKSRMSSGGGGGSPDTADGGNDASVSGSNSNNGNNGNHHGERSSPMSAYPTSNPSSYAPWTHSQLGNPSQVAVNNNASSQSATTASPATISPNIARNEKPSVIIGRPSTRPRSGTQTTQSPSGTTSLFHHGHVYQHHHASGHGRTRRRHGSGVYGQRASSAHILQHTGGDVDSLLLISSPSDTVHSVAAVAAASGGGLVTGVAPAADREHSSASTFLRRASATGRMVLEGLGVSMSALSGSKKGNSVDELSKKNAFMTKKASSNGAALNDPAMTGSPASAVSMSDATPWPLSVTDTAVATSPTPVDTDNTIDIDEILSIGIQHEQHVAKVNSVAICSYDVDDVVQLFDSIVLQSHGDGGDCVNTGVSAQRRHGVQQGGGNGNGGLNAKVDGNGSDSHGMRQNVLETPILSTRSRSDPTLITDTGGTDNRRRSHLQLVTRQRKSIVDDMRMNAASSGGHGDVDADHVVTSTHGFSPTMRISEEAIDHNTATVSKPRFASTLLSQSVLNTTSIIAIADAAANVASIPHVCVMIDSVHVDTVTPSDVTDIIMMGERSQSHIEIADNSNNDDGGVHHGVADIDRIISLGSDIAINSVSVPNQSQIVS